MEGEESLSQFSPEIRIQDPSVSDVVSSLPPFVLFHGTGDYSIPFDARLVYFSYWIDIRWTLIKYVKWPIIFNFWNGEVL